MAEVFNLDYLLARRETAAPGHVELMGRRYALRGVEAVESFLVFGGVVQRLLAEPIELPTDAEDMSPAALKAVSARYEGVMTEMHRMCRALVVDLPESLLRDHFGTLPKARALLMTLIECTRQSASAIVKKNAGGTVTKPAKKRRRRHRRSRGPSTGG